MGECTFYMVDVFTEVKYAGNPLAVLRDAKSLSELEMQQIAKEMNYSETTYILSEEQRNGGYDVRIFTPNEEIPFAGHPTLGTAYVIQREVIGDPVETVVLNLKVGQIPVSFKTRNGRADVLWMKQNNPTFGRILDLDSISESLGLKRGEIDERFPVQEVSTGLPFIIVPLKSLESVKKAKVSKEVFFELIEDTEAKAVLIFCPETIYRENDLNVRVFVDYYGIPEDPATGSANGCLAGYLVKTRYFENDLIDIRVEQGYEIGRPSLLFLRADKEGEVIHVSVGGMVVMVARGELM